MSTALNHSGTWPGSPFITVNSEWANLKYFTLKTSVQSSVIVMEKEWVLFFSFRIQEIPSISCFGCSWEKSQWGASGRDQK